MDSGNSTVFESPILRREKPSEKSEGFVTRAPGKGIDTCRKLA